MIFDHPRAGTPIKRWVYVITGFMQTAGTRTRMIDLWRGLDALTGNDTRIELRTWWADWDAEAEMVLRTADINHDPLILVFAYSWGAGWGAMEFAKRLEDRQLLIKHMVLSDPVYRHWYSAGNWRSFFPYIPIYIPVNVENVDWFRQVRDWPRAHPLLPLDKKATKVSLPITLPGNHASMDEAPKFLHKCEEVAVSYIEELFPPKAALASCERSEQAESPKVQL